MDVTLESRPTSSWDFYVGYTLSWLYGPGSEELFGAVNGLVNGFPIYSRHFNPRQAMFFDGYLRDDQRHKLKLRGSYTWHGLSVGMAATYSSGSAPLGKLYFNQALGAFANRRSPQGTEPGARNDLESVTEFRTPSALQVNTRVAYDLYEHIGQHLILIADLFNLLNQSQATELNTSDDQNFGQIAVRSQPFRAQFGVRYVY